MSYNYDDSEYNCILKFILRHMLFNVFSKPHFISYGIKNANLNMLAKYRKKGYFIIGWTYNDETNKGVLKNVYDNMIVENIEVREF